MHLGKPLLRRTITPQPRTLTEPDRPADTPAVTAEPLEEPAGEPQPAS